MERTENNRLETFIESKDVPKSIYEIEDSKKVAIEHGCYDSMKIFRNKKNEGIAHTRNVLIEHASGDYIYFIDSDDFMPDDAMEKILGTSIYRHIHLWEAKAYDQVDGQDEPPSVYNYIVGQFDKPNQSIATSPVVRQISRADGEAPVLNEIMPLIKMMQVGFVRMKNYTVLPFPAKYLREL